MAGDNAFAQRLRELRKKAGLTQEELAERVDVHLNTISRWENGIDTPKTFKIKCLAEALHVSELELLNGSTPEQWEIRMLVSKAGTVGEVKIDMTEAKSSATLNIGDTAMAITLSAGYELWEDDAKFEELLEQLRRKRAIGLKTRREDW